MFQIGFWECVVVALVALWVLGPEQLPTIATLAGRYAARLKNTLISLKTEFHQAALKTTTTEPPFEKEQPPKINKE